MNRIASPLKCAALTFLLTSCASDSNDVVPAPDREFEIDAGTEVESRGSLMLRAKSLSEQWIAVKSLTPRDIQVERRQTAFENALKDFSQRHRGALLDVLRRSGSQVHRSSAALCLGFISMHPEEVLEALIGALERDSSAYVRSDVLVGLGNLAHPRTPLDPVMDVIELGHGAPGESASYSMRTRAAYCMLRTAAAGAGDTSIGDRVILRLTDPEEDYLVISQLARAASGVELRTAATSEALTKLMRHTSPRVVTAAITSLSDIGAREAGPRIAEQMTAADPSVCIAARAALRQLFNCDEGSDPAAWKNVFLEAGIQTGS